MSPLLDGKSEYLYEVELNIISGSSGPDVNKCFKENNLFYLINAKYILNNFLIKKSRVVESLFLFDKEGKES